MSQNQFPTIAFMHNLIISDYYFIDPNGPLNGIQDAFQVYCRFHDDNAESCIPAGSASVSKLKYDI